MTENQKFPPLTPISEYPLHGWDYGSEYACQRPEDPDCLTFDWRCNACLLAAQAVIENRGDVEVLWRLNAETDDQPVMLTWLLDRAIYWLYEEAS